MCLSLFTFVCLASIAFADGLRAGAAAVEVTPEKFPVVVNGMFTERSATMKHDSLFARAIVLDDGKSPVAICVVDSCMMPRELLDKMKADASAATGIPEDRILISATHTHSAPAAMGCLGSDADPQYPAFLQAQVVRCLTMASKNRVAARAGWAVVDAPNHTFNRRWILRPDRIRNDPFGVPNVRAHMHPGYQNPDFIGPSGPVDTGLTLLAIETIDAKPLAILANYSMHYFGSPIVSGDYFGVFADNLAKRLGGEPIVMMSQGTSGDLMWMDYGSPKSNQTMERYGSELADLAFGAIKQIRPRSDLRLAMRETRLRLGRRVADEARLKWAKETVAKLNGRKVASQPEIYSREQLFLHAEPTRELKLQAIRIGELGIVAIPNEVFALTGLRLKALSPLSPTCVIELANGADGYIPPPAQHALGGYTTWPARTAGLEVEAEPKIVETLVGMLEDIAEKKRRPVAESVTGYHNAVLSATPVAYWRLGEFQGPTATDEMKRHAGRYEPGIAFYLDGVTKQSRCPHFAGGRVTANIPAIHDRYSVAFWFWNGMPANARAVTGYLLSHGPAGSKEASGDHLGIGGTNSHSGTLIVFNGNERRQLLAGSTTIEPKKWHHVVMTRDGPTVTVYLDGKLDIQGAIDATTPAGCKDWFLGGRSDRFANFEGKIDEAAFFDRVLSAKEVADLARVR
jgi:hypothetical protein